MAQLLTMGVQQDTAPISPRTFTARIFGCQRPNMNRNPGVAVFLEKLKEVSRVLIVITVAYLQ